MAQFFIKGRREITVRAIDFPAAAPQLLMKRAQELYGDSASLIGPSLDAGSFDGSDEVWTATVCLPDDTSPGERYLAGELFETIIRIA